MPDSHEFHVYTDVVSGFPTPDPLPVPVTHSPAMGGSPVSPVTPPILCTPLVPGVALVTRYLSPDVPPPLVTISGHTPRFTPPLGDLPAVFPVLMFLTDYPYTVAVNSASPMPP